MINKTDFTVIDTEIKKAISDTLENIKVKSVNNYVLFLANGEYKTECDNPHSQLSPFVIDNRTDFYKDKNRLQFLSKFLGTYYTFAPPQANTDDDQYRIHIEFMAYTQIWESKPFLKKLYRLAHLDSLEEYDWKVVVPEKEKHKFIGDDIRTTFMNNNNPMYEIIEKGYHSSLRNAFAHSEYAFNTMNGNTEIWLDNCKGKNWELQKITFDDWSKRFVYSALLSFYLFEITHQKRTSLETGTYRIRRPTKNGTTNNVDIEYQQDNDSFSLKM